MFHRRHFSPFAVAFLMARAVALTAAPDQPPSDAEYVKFYKDHKSDFHQAHLRRIRFENYDKAKAAYQQILSGEDFAKVAAERSIDPPVWTLGSPEYTGGLLLEAPPKGWVVDTVCKLKLGSVSEPITPNWPEAWILKFERIDDPPLTAWEVRLQLHCQILEEERLAAEVAKESVEAYKRVDQEPHYQAQDNTLSSRLSDERLLEIVRPDDRLRARLPLSIMGPPFAFREWNSALLLRLALQGETELLRVSAACKLVRSNELAAQIAIAAPDPDARICGLNIRTGYADQDDEGLRSKLALQDPSSRVRITAIERKQGGDQVALAKIALRDPVPAVRRAAVYRLWDQTTLAKIAAEDPDSGVRLGAVMALDLESPALERAAAEDPSSDVRVIGSLRIEDRKLSEIDLASKFIVQGYWARIPTLERMLTLHGSKELAVLYLNCGVKRLADAAENWGRAHGYRVWTSEDQRTPAARWGTQR